MTKSALIAKLEKRAKDAGSLFRLAATLGVSDSHMSDVLKHGREPQPKLLAALGVERVVTYRYVTKEPK